MADSESNPAYLIIGIISTLVLVFFVGNIWACVLPAPRSAASSARRSRPAVSHTSRPSIPPPGPFGLTRFSSSPRIRYAEAQKRYPKKPAKKMGAKKRAREMRKKGVQQAGE